MTVLTIDHSDAMELGCAEGGGEEIVGGGLADGERKLEVMVRRGRQSPWSYFCDCLLPSQVGL
jgi:hypothetical protein